jgi:hypothetical protein
MGKKKNFGAIEPKQQRKIAKMGGKASGAHKTENTTWNNK